MPPDSSETNGAARPEGSALDLFIASLYGQLRELARRRIRSVHGEHSLNTTGLVHEAYLRLSGSPDFRFADRTHFMAVASRVMRNVLVDHARSRASQKRGGSSRAVLLDEQRVAPQLDLDGVLDLDEALKRLETIDARQSQIVECRYFGGLSLEETASALDLSLSTTKRELRLARAWLAAELTRAST